VEFLKKHGDYLKKISPARYADYCYGATIGLLLARKDKDARHFAWQAVRYHLGMISYWVLWKLSWLPGGSHILSMFY
jgi:hypothetical protein